MTQRFCRGLKVVGTDPDKACTKRKKRARHPPHGAAKQDTQTYVQQGLRRDPDKAWTRPGQGPDEGLNCLPDNTRRMPREQNKDTHIASAARGQLGVQWRTQDSRAPGGQQQEDTRTKQEGYRHGHRTTKDKRRTQAEDSRRQEDKRRGTGQQEDSRTRRGHKVCEHGQQNKWRTRR